MIDGGQVNRLGKPGDEDMVEKRTQKGFLERKESDDHWQRYWCVLGDGCMYCYLHPEDKVPLNVIELTEYEISQVVDQERQLVLSLKHMQTNNNNILLRTDSTEEYTQWYESIKSGQETLSKETHKQKFVTQSALPQATEGTNRFNPGETVKQKLLAEVLRQKLELEKLQASRAGMKVNVHDGSQIRSDSLNISTSTVTASDKICTLTRLKQRRMSTQIKLSAIQKQMDASCYSAREKKMFQLVKKKPDLVEGHSEFDGHRPDLEEQAKLLSSKLQELDLCIMSHAADTADNQSQSRAQSRRLRHSYDQASLKNLRLQAEATRESGDELDSDSSSKVKEKPKDVGRSVSLKTSVQRFAYKTFSKANWHWNKKSSVQTDNKEGAKPSFLTCSNSLSDLTPDVIDMTHNSQLNRMIITRDGSGIAEPPHGFKTLPGHHKIDSHKTAQDEIFSRLSLSPSLARSDNFHRQMKTSISSPTLNKIMKQHSESLPKDDNPASHNAPANEDFNKSIGFTAPNSTKNQSSFRLATPRRQVNPNALAEIEAFEELSMKFLGSVSASK